MSYKKTLQEMNLLDRFLFAEVMEDNETLENVLEIIQGYPVPLEDKAQAEKELRRTPRNKRVFFDVYGEDIRNAVYDVEAQKENTHDFPKRTRYYNGMVDLNMLRPGEDYNKLKDVYIIMIMPFDLFGEGRYRYTFHMTCDEIPGLNLGDRVTRIFLNTQGRIKDGVSEELIQMLKYFENTTKETAAESQSEKIRQLEKRVEETKANEEVGIRFMNAFEEKMRERQEGREEGLAEGERIGETRGKSLGEAAKQQEIARKMLEEGLDLTLIQKITGLTRKKIQSL
ncbi:MAG: Rpn family recombination-promoting nuclease/putative transposase [Clostridia bacterium]